MRWDEITSEATTLGATDIVAIETSPSSTHVMKKITLLNFIKSLIKQNLFENGASIDNPPSGFTTAYTDANGFLNTKDSAGNVRKVNGIRYVTVEVFAPTEICSIGDGKKYVPIPTDVGGMNMVYKRARCITAGTTGTMDIQIRNVTDSVDMLSTKETIDSTETGSETAATPGVIDGAHDDVAEDDLLAIDIDAVHTTPAYGLYVTLGFQYP